MNNTITIYPGQYVIHHHNGAPHICSYQNKKNTFTIQGLSWAKEFFSELTKLSTDDTTNTIKFLNKYGPLYHFTYEKVRFQFTNNVNGSQKNIYIDAICSYIEFDLFVHLIKNLLLLSTSIKKYELYKKESIHDSSIDMLNLLEATITDAIQYFLNSVIQPAAVLDCIKYNATFFDNLYDSLVLEFPRYLVKYMENHSITNISDGVVGLCTLITSTRQDIKRIDPNLLIPRDDIIMDDISNALENYFGEIIDKRPADILDTDFYSYCITSAFQELTATLVDIFSMFDISFSNGSFSCKAKSGTVHDIPSQTINQIISFSHLILCENVNTFTSAIHPNLTYEKNYVLSTHSDNLLHAVFLLLGDIVNRYQFTICKYRKCNNIVISTSNRPALCCCHTHLTNYLASLKKTKSTSTKFIY